MAAPAGGAAPAMDLFAALEADAPPPAGASEAFVLVVGSRAGGKTTLVQSLLGGGKGA